MVLQTDFLPTVGSNPLGLQPLPTVGSNPLGPQPPSGELRHPPRVTQYLSEIVSPVGGAPSRACCARFSRKDLVARAATVHCGPANRDTDGRRARDLGKISSKPVTFSPLPQILSSPSCWPLKVEPLCPQGHSQQRRWPPPPAASPAVPCHHSPAAPTITATSPAISTCHRPPDPLPLPPATRSAAIASGPDPSPTVPSTRFGFSRFSSPSQLIPKEVLQI